MQGRVRCGLSERFRGDAALSTKSSPSLIIALMLSALPMIADRSFEVWQLVGGKSGDGAKEPNSASNMMCTRARLQRHAAAASLRYPRVMFSRMDLVLVVSSIEGELD